MIRALLSGAGSLWVSGCTCSGEGAKKMAGSAGYKIIVVGAGMAGIACARALVRSGFTVVVLEAQGRVGGRVYTDRSLGFAVERGANWIEGERGNPVAAAARDASVRTVVDSSEGAFFDHDGRRLTDEEVASLEEVGEAIEEALEEVADEADRDQAVEPALLRLLARETLTAFERRAVSFALASVELDLAGGLERASLEHTGEGDGFGGESLFMPDGYDKIVEGVARGLDVRLSEPVEEVHVGADGARVRTSRGTHEADGVVVSVPLGVLKAGRIRFDPPLGERKRAAIGRLEMGTLNKVILSFERAFWPADVGTFFYVSETRGEFPQIVDWNAFGGRPALLLFQAGRFAAKAEAWSDEESVARAMNVVRRCFGQTAPRPTGWLVQRWNADPWTLGSYSFLPAGASPEDRKALAAPEGERLYFCGEATSEDYPATVHGAYLSGERTAARIAEVAGVR